MVASGFRIAQIGKYYPPHIGGMETHLQVLCGELRRSLDVKVLVANDGPRCDEGVVDGVNVTRVAPPSKSPPRLFVLGSLGRYEKRSLT